MKGRFKQAATIVGIATTLGLFFAEKGYLLSRDNYGTALVAKVVWWNVVDWYGWALLVPAIFSVCGRLARLGRRTILVSGHIAAGLLFALAHGAILTTAAWIEARVLHTGWSWHNLWRQFFLVDHTFDDVVTYFVIVCAWMTVAYYRKFKEKELGAAHLESQLVRAELQALKTQLSPHFLFNILNGISSLNYEDPRTANRMLAKLSDLLRIALADDPEREATLGAELDFNRQYLELEQMRLGERLSFEIDAHPETLAARFPALLLQPLVENAVRHGIAPYSRNGRIWVRSGVRNGMLEVEVGDNGPGKTTPGFKSQQQGIGLKNIRERLQRMYEDRHGFTVEDRGGNGFLVRISMPYERPDGAPASTACIPGAWALKSSVGP
jgi:two-component system LytT family sensor kinase